ncbi:hypothetical protein [Bacillus sp. V59.32b]|uniref:hypothetical protein n=1 Tax=Bacillus sp. V59.32b TaxID=1758642 RepID=UPI000E3C46DC|nr:hypothetical protein [Bacillus sp. V59.32b]RFU64611.1 hypothetical protein D0463_09960 [Bacillus sp. V59.32b]
MKEQMRLDEYTRQLMEQRKHEVIKDDPINEHNLKSGLGLTSPNSAMSTEELRLFMEYMDQANLRSVTEAKPERKKPLMLKKFFKSKRNQQVEVYSKTGGNSIYTLGKVSAVGRDFVMLTNLRDRMWLPYSAIDSANIPFGMPNYSNTHQHFIYDNNLRNKLLTNFGETVANRDILVQQFFEESLQTNLHSWKGTWVEIQFGEEKVAGKIDKSEEGVINLSVFSKKHEVPLKDVTYISNLRWFHFLTKLWK